MTNNHLTDENLQVFLLTEMQDDIVATHLTVCSECRKRLEEYQYLIDSMRKIETETFFFDVTSLVMKSIREAETRKEKKTNIVLYMSLAILSIIVLLLLYPYMEIISTQFKSFSTIANVFMLVSAFGVAIFLVNDLFRQYKQKEKLLW